MPSLFPGMNPYVEQDDAWQDFHGRSMAFTADLLNAQIGSEYIVKYDEHLYIHDVNQDVRTFLGRADVAVTHHPGVEGGDAATALLEAPVQIRLPTVDVERVPFLEIRDRRSRQLVTVIELLSPSNKKRGRDRDQYILKRDQLFASPVDFIEIDLLRGGPRMPFEKPPECDYYALVSRAEQRPDAGLWPVRLREPLPTIPIPLRAPHLDLRLDLQAVLHRIYDAAGYQRFIYDSEPEPPLRSDDAAWARQFVPVRN